MRGGARRWAEERPEPPWPGLLRRIEREAGLEGLLDRLAPRSSTALLLEVFHRRAGKHRPASIARVGRPAAVDPRAVLELNRLALSLLPPPFQPLELSR
ncbi:MAG: hypothetical protein AB1758_11430 [Candidatus Eremiobacterota bacterium]